jgi:sulfur-oxidizing protein SoxX
MKTKYKMSISAGVLLSSVCATVISMPSGAQDLKNFKASFAEKGIAKMDRLDQSELQKNCSDYAKKPMPAKMKAKLEKAELNAVKYPVDGNYLGDWKEGEKIAQNGRGLQFSDDIKTVNGGNCYACHQISKTEIAFGNIGPSLAEYGKLRGGPTPEIVKYTWSKLYSSHAYNACSVMPRYGAGGILNEQQLKDVMALLLDPKSPINQ